VRTQNPWRLGGGARLEKVEERQFYSYALSALASKISARPKIFPVGDPPIGIGPNGSTAAHRARSTTQVQHFVTATQLSTENEHSHFELVASFLAPFLMLIPLSILCTTTSSLQQGNSPSRHAGAKFPHCRLLCFGRHCSLVTMTLAPLWLQ